MKKLIIILIMVLLSGCGKREFGRKISINKFTPVLQLKKYPQNYLNKIVKIQGKVVEESELGLWITIQDNYIIMMIILEEFEGIPKILNKNIKIIGTLIKQRDGYCMNAKWLKIE